MRVIIDIETNGLINPTKVWCIVCKDLDTYEYEIFRRPSDDQRERERFIAYAGGVSVWIGHNILGYDYPVLSNLLGFKLDSPAVECRDTLLLSKLIDYSRKGHSVEDYGIEFSKPKGEYPDWSKYSPEMEEYCIRDVDITELIWLKYLKYMSDRSHAESIQTEHSLQWKVVNALHSNGFYFDKDKAERLLDKVVAELSVLDTEISGAFRPKSKLIREVVPKATQYGTISKGSIPSKLRDRTSDFTVGAAFSYITWVEFNPSSHKQLVSVLWDAGWQPVDKTATHIEALRSQDKEKLPHLERYGWKINENNLSTLPDYDHLELWKNTCRIKILNEDAHTIRNGKEIIQITSESMPKNIILKIKDLENTGILNDHTAFLLKTLKECLPSSMDSVEFVKSQSHSWSIIVTPQDVFVDCSASNVIPTWHGMKNTQVLQTYISRIQAAKLLAKRIMLESRRRTLTEWLGLVSPDGRIHGDFFGLGAWTHRMSHQKPNTANVPNDTDINGKVKLLGGEMRALWRAPKGKLLVGVDAEGIQLRIFAHYINDPEFTQSLISGKKEDKSDPHSLNQRILGPVCKTRAAAKRFIFALLLGGGISKLAQILETSEDEARSALERILERYTGFALLKKNIIPADGRRGWFIGLDGRRVRIPGETSSERRHLCMSGYLQNGEAVVMKKATLRWMACLEENYPELYWKIVNFVHDEWQTETSNKVDEALIVAKAQADSLIWVGNYFNLRCPLAGSYWNEDKKDYTIGTNWRVTH